MKKVQNKVKFRPWITDKSIVNYDCSHQFDEDGQCSKCAAYTFVALVDKIYNQVQKSGETYEKVTGRIATGSRNILKKRDGSR